MDILQKLGSLPIFLIMFIIIYFLMIRPQVNQQKAHSNLVKSLKKGDKIITRGGICGEIIDLHGKNKVVISSNNTKIVILRTHITTIDT